MLQRSVEREKAAGRAAPKCRLVWGAKPEDADLRERWLCSTLRHCMSRSEKHTRRRNKSSWL